LQRLPLTSITLLRTACAVLRAYPTWNRRLLSVCIRRALKLISSPTLSNITLLPTRVRWKKILAQSHLKVLFFFLHFGKKEICIYKLKAESVGGLAIALSLYRSCILEEASCWASGRFPIEAFARRSAVLLHKPTYC